MQIFEKLKRPNRSRIEADKIPPIFFQIRFDSNGAWLAIVDKQGDSIEPDYRSYHGAQRDIIKLVEHTLEKNSFVINWEQSNNKVYVSNNELLLWHLKRCDNLIDESFNPVRFADGFARLILHIEGATQLTCRIMMQYKGRQWGQVRLLNENYVFVDRVIYEIEPLGEDFDVMPLFETELAIAELEKYLSLLYSYFESITVVYQDYRQMVGPSYRTIPSLIFEKIDADNSLSLRISRSVPGFGADFLDGYDVSKVVTINELEKIFVVSELIEDEFATQIFIQKKLNQYKKKLKQIKRNDYYNEDDLFIIEENLAKHFVHQELPEFIQKFAVFGAEKLKSYKVKAVTPKLQLNFGFDIDFLEGDAQLEIEGQSFNLFDALQQFRKQAYVTLHDGTHAIVNQKYLKKLERVFKKRKNKARISFFDLPIIEELLEEQLNQDAFIQSRKIFEGFNLIQHSQIDYPQLGVELRPYQKQGCQWLNYLHQYQLGGCLADDMGLGKTLQAIAMISLVYPKELLPTLVVMPKSLLFNWEHEIKKFNPTLTHYTYHGGQRNLVKAKKNNIIFTTYGMLRNSIESFKEESFYYVILDESQNIKNFHSQTAKSVMLLKAKHRLALSGTPIENNLGELYSLFRFLNPAMFGSQEEFNRNYTIPIHQYNDKEAANELKTKIYPFVLRRLKKEVLDDLPDKIEQTLFVEMPPQQAAFYEQRRRFYYHTVRSEIAQHGLKQSQFTLLQAFTELRQIASTPEALSEGRIRGAKREMLQEHLVDAIANHHKILIFANYLSAIEHIGQDMRQAQIQYLVMTGATRDRQSLIEQFQNDPNYKVFLMTLKTGGLGLNLTAADTIFIFDPWWNISAENQAMDRAHRIGQDKTVFSYKLISKGTIEEKILQLQSKKHALFENIIGSDSASIKSLDERDIEYILGN